MHPLRFGGDCTGLGTDAMVAKDLNLNFVTVFGCLVQHHQHRLLFPQFNYENFELLYFSNQLCQLRK